MHIPKLYTSYKLKYLWRHFYCKKISSQIFHFLGQHIGWH